MVTGMEVGLIMKYTESFTASSAFTIWRIKPSALEKD